MTGSLSVITNERGGVIDDTLAWHLRTSSLLEKLHCKGSHPFSLSEPPAVALEEKTWPRLQNAAPRNMESTSTRRCRILGGGGF